LTVASGRPAADDCRVQAIVMTEFGPPEVLVASEVDDPQPVGDQVVIDVEYVNVTFVDTQIRAGRAPRREMAPVLPAIPGNGVGGAIAGTGARVISSTGGSGAYAERVAIPAASAIPVPDGLPMRYAVALLSDGRTALGLIRRAGVSPGEVVLVEAAAGGVGSLLLQLAKQAGAYVVAAASGEQKLEFASYLGADAVVDYSTPDWAKWLEPVDVVFDGIGGDIGHAAFGLLRRGGRHCAFGMASGRFAAITEEESRARGVTAYRGAVTDATTMSALTAEALDRAAAGSLQPVVGQTLALARAAEAHGAIESRRTLGKTLLATG
jgi:NADPH2:quinone reductase